MSQIPLIILGGRDRRPADLPASGKGLRTLHGYKGADLEIGGAPLITRVIERMSECGAFGPIFVAGPKRIYEGIVPEECILETDGGFGDNLRTGIDSVRSLDPELIAVTTCDILPDPDELQIAVQDLLSRQPLDFWMPHIPVTADDLGSSEWKPRYWLQPPGSAEALATLPGHIVVADIRPLRLPFVYHLFDLFYATRNASVARRRLGILPRVLGFLLREDWGYLRRGERPYAFFDVLYNGLKMAAHLKAGRAVTTEFEDRIRKLFYTRQHRRLYPQRRGRIAILDVLSLARDIDTEEEAEEFQRLAETAP
ncbi:MAG: hypothetical protein AAF725_02110 [Acidobacteriota bacterium]